MYDESSSASQDSGDDYNPVEERGKSVKKNKKSTKGRLSQEQWDELRIKLKITDEDIQEKFASINIPVHFHRLERNPDDSDVGNGGVENRGKRRPLRPNTPSQKGKYHSAS
jgi:hypothetical protein